MNTKDIREKIELLLDEDSGKTLKDENAITHLGIDADKNIVVLILTITKVGGETEKKLRREIAVIVKRDLGFAGVKIQFEYPPETPYTPYAETAAADVERSKNGHILGVSTYNPVLNLQAQFGLVSRTWLDAYYIPFWQNHARLFKPFFFVWDLDTYSADVFFVSIGDDASLETPFSVLTYTDV